MSEITLPKIIQNMLQYECTGAKEWSYMVCSEADFKGNRYPAPYSTPRWDEWIQVNYDDLPMLTIASVFVPPHAEWWVETSNENGNLRAVFRGPGFLVHVDKHLWWWDASDIKQRTVSCDATLTPLCRTLVQWKDVSRWQMHRWIPWTDWLHHVLVKQKQTSIDMFGYRHMVTSSNFVSLNKETVTSNRCFQAFERLRQLYPKSYAEIPIDWFDRTCDPTQQLVPQGAHVSNGTLEECWNMIQSQLKHQEFVFADDTMGMPTVSCGSRAINNVNRSVWEDPSLQQIQENDLNDEWKWSVYSLFVICFIVLGLISCIMTRRESISTFHTATTNGMLNALLLPWKSHHHHLHSDHRQIQT